MRFTHIWDLKNKASYYKHIKIKLHMHILLVLKSHIWHVLNYIYIDLKFPDDKRSAYAHMHKHYAHAYTHTHITFRVF